MNNFPDFMKKAANIVPREQQNTPDIEGYYYTANNGDQCAFWHYPFARVSKKHSHKFDEYMVCIEGEVTVHYGGNIAKLHKGDELVVEKGVEHYEKVKANTRMLYIFGGKRIED